MLFVRVRPNSHEIVGIAVKIGLSVKFGEKSSSAGYLENLHPLQQRFLEARS